MTSLSPRVDPPFAPMPGAETTADRDPSGTGGTGPDIGDAGPGVVTGGGATEEPTRRSPRVGRRGALRYSLAVAAGAAAGVAGTKGVEKYLTRYPLPFYDGYAATIHANRRTGPASPQLVINWGVNTSKRLVALTFDDGPMPQWTPQVHAILSENRVRATFFMIGTHARDHRDLVAGKLGDHEVGNHTWQHRDLARMEYAEARAAIEDGHQAIATATGREPALLRPPYGHLAGSSLLAASDLGYPVVLWNQQMVESDYPSDPQGLAAYIAGSCTPGTILLAHDTGSQDRLVAIRSLPAMIKKLRARGFEFVTVSELLQEH